MVTEKKYNTIREYLDHLIAGKESSCVEFKYGKGEFPYKEFWPSYSSFANTDGGVIIIGVKEKNGNFYPEGLSADTVGQYEKIFWDSVNDTNQVSRKLMINKDVIKDDYNGNYFLIFFIPRASSNVSAGMSYLACNEVPYAVCCVVPCLLDDGIWPMIICHVMLAFVLVKLFSIYYRIEGYKLIVYTFFRVHKTTSV